LQIFSRIFAEGKKAAGTGNRSKKFAANAKF
jgi:hypothetical protein